MVSTPEKIEYSLKIDVAIIYREMYGIKAKLVAIRQNCVHVA